MRSRRKAEEPNDAYAVLMDSYDLHSTHINRGDSHENSVTEQGHHRLKETVDQALILRDRRI